MAQADGPLSNGDVASLDTGPTALGAVLTLICCELFAPGLVTAEQANRIIVFVNALVAERDALRESVVRQERTIHNLREELHRCQS